MCVLGKLMNLSSSFLILFFGVLLPLQATAATFKLKYSEIEMNIPSNWQSVEDLYGMPLMILGPEVEEKRPVISVVSTNISNISFDKNSVKESSDSYTEGRKEWLAEKSGVLIKFIPYNELNWRNVEQVHSIGYVYELNKHQFIETTYYVSCKNKLFNLKTLTTSNHTKYNSEMDKIMRSFKCK